MTAPLSCLDGIRVLDFSHVYQGPVATQLLADYGADVIKIERQGSGDWSRAWGPFVQEVSLPFANLNRNKRSLTVDMKSAEGKEIISRLIPTADILVHNFRPGVMEKLGFGYADCSRLNEGLIYASSSGWGDVGPHVDRGRAGHDMMARAEGGWFLDMGEGQAPIPGGISVDYPSGLMLLQGILMAMLHRERGGKGQQVSTDLLSVAFHAHAWDAASELNAAKIDAPARVGGTEAAINKAFLTADGAIELSPVFSDNSLRDISLALGLEDLSLREEFATVENQMAGRTKLNRILAEQFATKSTAAWMEELEKQGVLCARVHDFHDAASCPQIAANNMVIDLEHPRAGRLKVLGTPVRLSRTPPRQDGTPPDLGADSREILTGLGYEADALDRLEAKGVIGG